MAYHLVHRYGLNEAPQYGKETFPTEMEAIDRASERFAAGDPGDFVIEDDAGLIILDNFQIKTRCWFLLERVRPRKDDLDASRTVSWRRSPSKSAVVQPKAIARSCQPALGSKNLSQATMKRSH